MEPKLLLPRIRELLPRLGRLAAQRVRPATQQNYLYSLEELCQHLGGCARVEGRYRLPAWRAATWDPVLVDFLETMYDLGRSKEHCSRVPHALRWAEPGLGPSVRSCLPRTHALLAGWDKLEPGSSRPPLPRVVAVAIATKLCQDGFGMEGLAVLTMFHTYMRPSEMVDLRCFQLVRGDPKGEGHLQDFTFVLHAHELGTPSKTGLRDCCIPLDLEEHRWIAALWDLYARFTVHAGGARVFSFSYKHLLTVFKETAAELGVQSLEPTLHCLRHGGASWDFATKVRDLDGIQKRGMWKSPSSVARYAKPGRIGMQLSKIGGRARKRCVELEKESKFAFADFFRMHYAVDD